MAKNDKGEDQNNQQQNPDDHSAQQRQMRFVEQGVKTQYANIFNIGFGAEEVMLVFGNNSVDPNVVLIESKMAVSIKTAKRIAITLGNLLTRYESINGEIDISVPAAATGTKTNIQ